MAATLKPGSERPTNLTRDQKELAAYFMRLDALHQCNADHNDDFRSDMKAVYEEAAAALAMTRNALRHEYGLRRAKQKADAREKNFDASEMDDLDRIRAALGDLYGTPLGNSATS